MKKTARYVVAFAALTLTVLSFAVERSVPSAIAQAPQQQARQVEPAPNRRAGEGEGPFERLIIRGATMIDGTGAPPMGPVDIVIVNNRISEIRSVGFPKAPIRADRRPEAGTREIDAAGMYVTVSYTHL